MHRVTKRLLVASSIFMLLVLSSLGQSLVLRDHVAVDGQGVHLGDLVVAEQTLPLDWAQRVVSDSPMPGETRYLRLGDIARALHKYSDMQQVVLHGKTEIRVNVKVAEFEVTCLETAIADYLADDVDWSERRFRVSRRTASLPAVPTAAEWEPKILGVDETTSGISARVQFVAENGKLPEQGFYTVELEELFPYWQAKGPLLRGTVLGADDLDVRWLGGGEGGRYYAASESIAGMELRRNLQGGQMIVIGSLAEPMYARRGEIVRVFIEQGGLRVTLRARALEDARRDERVPCLNERSGRRLYVRMVSPREAILEDGGGSES